MNNEKPKPIFQRRIFWDVDAPATLAEIRPDPNHRLRRLLPQIDAVLTATARTARDHYFQSNSPVLEGSADVPSAAPANSGWEALRSGWSAPVDH